MYSGRFNKFKCYQTILCGYKMLLYLYITLITIRLSCSIPDKKCDRIQIGEQWFEKEVLWKDLGKPYNLNVHKPSNTIFLSFSAPEISSDADFQLGTLNIDTKEYTNVAGIRGGCSTAIDQDNDEIYLGGSDGIYKFNMATKLADFYKEKGKNIWSLFHRRNLFYISYPEQKLYMEVDGKFAIVKEFQHFEVEQFFTSRNGDIYFANNTGLYEYNRSKLKSEVLNDLLTVRQITQDNNGFIYTCTNFGVFNVTREGLNKILDMKNVYGLAFDRDNNYILADDRQVMKLVKSNQSCVVEDYW